MENKIL